VIFLLSPCSWLVSLSRDPRCYQELLFSFHGACWKLTKHKDAWSSCFDDHGDVVKKFSVVSVCEKKKLFFLLFFNPFIFSEFPSGMISLVDSLRKHDDTYWHAGIILLEKWKQNYDISILYSLASSRILSAIIKH
jgi:hypothetical protein